MIFVYVCREKKNKCLKNLRSMKTICLTFRIHQPYRLKRYRFSEIGNDHYYYDDFLNEDSIRTMAGRCYMPANRLLLEMIKNSGNRFKVSFDISGIALDQMEIYTPEVIDSFKELAATGNVEFLAGTFSHSLSALHTEEEFVYQTKCQLHKLKSLFGVTPQVYCNTGLIYSEQIAQMTERMGFRAVLAEGAPGVLGWRSPNYLYKSSAAPSLKLMFRHAGLSEDVSLRFQSADWNQYPLNAEKYMSWIGALPPEEQLVNLYMNYEVVGGKYGAETGIFDFFRSLPEQGASRGIGFSTPSEIVKLLKPVDSVAVPNPVSYQGDKTLAPWLGNELQRAAFEKINRIGSQIVSLSNRRLIQEWLYLAGNDHLRYMESGLIGRSPSSTPYETPFSAFGNYMNVLSDFAARVATQLPPTHESDEQNPLLSTIRKQEEEIAALEKEMKKYKK